MSDGDRATTDELYRCVANQRRRSALVGLRDDEDGAATVGDLVDHVLDRADRSSAPGRESVRLDLYHCHLPMLDDAGVVDFDRETETVRFDGLPDVDAASDPPAPFLPGADISGASGGESE
ncbi:DUF7344 domain-containing protein [Halosimplex pelagicum]|uniref:DUF7344 domain-containing protein n=1 Tax=Halosimplex pelagicum TaxID=869886 RepID=A0A7D5P3N4_9EURY|nr:hypothetical protein [Halosimplex pelagicum]QLH80126.1 hypothetical protein HZS54_00125 [Halosimplex pelagicum]